MCRILKTMFERVCLKDLERVRLSDALYLPQGLKEHAPAHTRSNTRIQTFAREKKAAMWTTSGAALEDARLDRYCE